MCEVLLNVIDDTAHQILITTGGVSMGEKVRTIYCFNKNKF